MSKIKNTNSAQRGYRNWEGGGGVFVSFGLGFWFCWFFLSRDDKQHL